MENMRGADVLLTGWRRDGGVVALGALIWANWALILRWQWADASHTDLTGLWCLLNLKNDDFWPQKVPRLGNV